MHNFLLKGRNNYPSVKFWCSLAGRKIHERVKNWSDLNLKDTIYALSSGSGKCAISCIRISGPHSSKIFSELADPPVIPKPRVASLKKLLYPYTASKIEEREIIDEVIAIYFQAPHSFTGEDMVELFVHGSNSVRKEVLETLGKLQNFGMAEPGEFIQRAMKNGKMSLSSVEGVADLINSETNEQRKQALRQLSGKTEKVYLKWSQKLSKLYASIEAIIDFGEDEMINIRIVQDIYKEVASLKSEIEAHLNDGNRGEMIRSGISVAIVGPPNAGKSSLLNLISKRSASIVSPVKGTTRDVVEVRMDISGYPVILADTAGISDDISNEIELEGVRRSKERIILSSLIILMIDINDVPSKQQLDLKISEILGINEDHSEKQILVVLNKTDLLQQKPDLFESDKEITFLYISCATGEGVTKLIEVIQEKIGNYMLGNSEKSSESVITRSRHRIHLDQANKSLSTFIDMYDDSTIQSHLDVAAEELRESINCIGRITGRVDIEDILDQLFKDFCIGK
jgi:tRNA modification GTPase